LFVREKCGKSGKNTLLSRMFAVRRVLFLFFVSNRENEISFGASCRTSNYFSSAKLWKSIAPVPSKRKYRGFTPASIVRGAVVS
jgi:hypothetical protein